MSLGAVIGFSLCAAALCVLLRQYRPEIALVISILCGVGVLRCKVSSNICLSKSTRR